MKPPCSSCCLVASASSCEPAPIRPFPTNSPLSFCCSYAGDYAALTGNSSFALDACLIDNVCLQDLTDVQQSATAIMAFMANLSSLRAASKRANTFVLLSLANAASNVMCSPPASPPLTHFHSPV